MSRVMYNSLSDIWYSDYKEFMCMISYDMNMYLFNMQI